MTQQSSSSEEISCVVLEVNNEEVMPSTVSSIGHQMLLVRIDEGQYKNQEISVSNLLMGQAEYDELYKIGDHIIAALQIEENEIISARAVSMDRSIWLYVMIGLMAVLLLAYGRWVGYKALLSFGLSIWIIWTVLIRGLLSGQPPILLTTVTVIILSAIIIFLVSGFNRRGLSAFIGTISGLMITLIITHLFGSKMGLHGMTQPYSQALIISGFFNLNLLEIFYAAIILGASGAAMDISVDIAASMHEIKLNQPFISRKKLINSGLNVGRQVIGTMTTTLLLAYSGSYLTLLMLFMAKDTTFIRMMNMKIVVSEVLRTVMGSIGLILVAPLTALVAGILMVRKDEVCEEKAIMIDSKIN
jgi:uncharacterized membrane protein